MKTRILPLLLGIFLLLAPDAFSQNYAASVRVSTTGINLEGIRSFGNEFNARLGLAFFSYNYDGGGGTEDYSYSANLKLLSFSVLGDWFPFQNALRITGGLFVNLNKGDMKLTPAKTYTVGGSQYTPEKLGNLSALVDFNKVAPYLGIGIGNPTAGSSGLGFSLDIGTFYQGSPNVDLSADGLLTPSAEQGPVIEDNLSWFKFYPVVSLGISYKF